MKHRLIFFFCIICIFATSPGYSLEAPPVRQMVVSVTNSWDDFHAVVYRFEQAAGEWKRVGRGVPAVVGEKGLAWDPMAPERDTGRAPKREGDLRAPAGRFDLSGAMAPSSARPPAITIPFRAIEPGTHCVDDAASGFYNRIVDEGGIPGYHEGVWKSSERMWLETVRYRLLLLVDYNVRDPKPGNGSCIFMHIWLGEGKATTGCTAMAAADLEEIVTWLKPEGHPMLVQLPREVYRQVWRKWRLPAPELVGETGATK
jgi:L,D-peptidoglycan transpeptidase YkuD (ErfK/YbiS/YcfS/YnhG family)